jgi:hypothetical protein
LPWDALSEQATSLTKLVGLARDWKILPEAYLYGIAEQTRHATSGHSGYALGLYSETGWWWYFPFALLVKSPVSFLLLLLLPLCSRPRGGRAGRINSLRWLVFPASFLMVALSIKINIGIRYLLPIFPFLMLLAGSTLDGTFSAPLPRLRTLALGLTISGILECLSAAPFFTPYMNWPSVLLAERHDILADSNLDWGQDLARLKEYLDENKISDVKLSYFGTASPRQLGLTHQALPGFNLYSRLENEWPRGGDPAPGDTVAISASNLLGLYVGERWMYYELLNRLKPVAVVGHSIYIYKIPPDSGR